jgi:1-acyl-sn-glycerol-3-phosphate acyltransferase
MQISTLNSLLTFAFHALTEVEVSGTENVPREGSAILATNHLSRIDSPLLFVTTPRRDLIALVADSYKTNPFFAFLVKTNGSIWIDREKADFSAIRAALDYLRKNHGLLGIAPEGTRSRVGSLIQAKPGVAMLAEKANVPIIPVAIHGTEDAMVKIRTLRRPKLVVRFGKPFNLPPMERENRDDSLQANADEIMCHIAALLPAHYWGYYRAFPRVQELALTGDS